MIIVLSTKTTSTVALFPKSPFVVISTRHHPTTVLRLKKLGIQTENKSKRFKLNLQAMPMRRVRHKSKYDIMMDDLDKLKNDDKVKNMLQNIPLARVGLMCVILCDFI